VIAARAASWLPASLAASLLGACGAAPPTNDPIAALAIAEEWLEAGRAKEARDLLNAFDAEQYEGAALERHTARRGLAYLRSGDPYLAYYVVRNFTNDHPYVSKYYGDVEWIEYEAGRQMIESTWSFLFFANHSDDGKMILEHFIQHFPRSRYMPDALQLLGAKAFRERDWNLARARYTTLRLEHPDSEWAPLAQYRVAMSGFASLVGPAYDQAEMRATERELAGFLATQPQNPAFAAEATRALGLVREWIARREVVNADFYRTIGNAQGERLHLAAAARDYPDTVAGREAQARLSP
jgi:outer membrane protein assembly factor BamD (BamD/ComL family)